MQTLKPIAVQISKSRRLLLITWPDGHKSEYPWDRLRAACPCVTYRGGHENMGLPPDPNIFNLPSAQSYDLTRADLIGNYALQLLWSDAHRYGLDTCEYL